METNKTYFNVNSTEKEHLLPFSLVVTFVLVLSLIFTLSILFNIISIASILSAKAFTTINLLILNLSIADIIYSTGIPLFIVQLCAQAWPFGSIGCRIFLFTEFSGIIVGLFTVTALSVERFFDIADKKKRLESISKKSKLTYILFYLILIWILAFCFSFPLIKSIVLVKQGEQSTCNSDWKDSSLQFYFIFKFVVIFLVPYLIIAFSSAKLLIFLKHWKKRLSTSSNLSQYKIIKALSFGESTRRSFIFNLTFNLRTCSCTRTSKSSASSQGGLFNKSFDLAENSELTYSGEVRNSLSKSSNRIVLDCGYVCGSYSNSMRRKAIRLVLSIVFLFLVQWSPLWIFQFIVMFSSGYIKHVHLINFIVSTLSYSNTVANPLVYMLLTYNFKMYSQNNCVGKFIRFFLKDSFKFKRAERNPSCVTLNIELKTPNIVSNCRGLQ